MSVVRMTFGPREAIERSAFAARHDVRVRQLVERRVLWSDRLEVALGP